MTSKMNTTIKTVLFAGLIMTLMVPITGIGDVYASHNSKKYGYSSVDPTGGEITKVTGDTYTYRTNLNTDNKSLTNSIYLTNVDFSVGVGYNHFINSGGTETVNWVRYIDKGPTYNNYYYVSSGGPSGEIWADLELREYTSTKYKAYANGSYLGTLTCSGTCPSPNIAGAAVYSNSVNDKVRASFKDLKLETSSNGYIPWDNAPSNVKCYKYNADSLKKNNLNELKVDLSSSGYDCSIKSSQWLYNAGSGGTR